MNFNWETLKTAGLNVIQNMGAWFWGGLLGGRSFVITLVALIMSFWLALHHLLDGTWVATLSAVLGATHTRAICGDYHAWRMKQGGRNGNTQQP